MRSVLYCRTLSIIFGEMFNLRVLEWNDEGNGTTLNKEGKEKK